MNSKVIGLVVGVLLIAGGVFFVVSGDSDDAANTNSSQLDPNAEGVESTASNQLGINTAALNGAYQLDIQSNEGGEELSGTFLLDGNGNFSSEVMQDGQTVGFVYLDGVTYVQNPSDQSWFAYPAGSTAAPSFDVDDLALSDDDIEEINSDQNVESLGEEACSLGTCRVYQDTDEITGEVAVVKVDTATGRLAEISLTNQEGTETSTIMYSYPETIEIVAPEGATLLDDLTQ